MRTADGEEPLNGTGNEVVYYVVNVAWIIFPCLENMVYNNLVFPQSINNIGKFCFVLYPVSDTYKPYNNKIHIGGEYL